MARGQDKPPQKPTGSPRAMRQALSRNDSGGGEGPPVDGRSDLLPSPFLLLKEPAIKTSHKLQMQKTSSGGHSQSSSTLLLLYYATTQRPSNYSTTLYATPE